MPLIKSALRPLWVLLFVLFALSFKAEAEKPEKPEKPGPQITFATTSHDFGNIREDGGNVRCTFDFTNTGTEPLVINQAKAACGCTKPTFTSTPVAPGKKGQIRVSYVPLGRPGEFIKTITVRSNSVRNKKTTLKITGFVLPAKE